VMGKIKKKRRIVIIRYIGDKFPQYKGKDVALYKIADASEGVTRQSVYDRWKKENEPSVVDDSLLVPAVGFQPKKTYHLMPDDTWHTGVELARMFNVSKSKIQRLGASGKKEFTREEMIELSGSTQAFIIGKVVDRIKKKNVTIEDIAYNSSPMERALLAL